MLLGLYIVGEISVSHLYLVTDVAYSPGVNVSVYEVEEEWAEDVEHVFRFAFSVGKNGVSYLYLVIHTDYSPGFNVCVWMKWKRSEEWAAREY